MTLNILTPDEIEAPLYEGYIDFDQQQEKSIKDYAVERPYVTLGEPQWWSLSKLAREKGELLPAEFTLLLKDSDFYLVQIGCSFRPPQKGEIQWARLTSYLRPKVGQNPPIAFDIFPREISEERLQNVKISIAPSLKFETIEGTVGEIATTISFRKLEPVVVGYGILESTPNWDFEFHDLYPLRGSRFVYIILKKPIDAKAVRLTLEIHVGVQTDRGLLRAKLKESTSQHLTRLICSD